MYRSRDGNRANIARRGDSGAVSALVRGIPSGGRVQNLYRGWWRRWGEINLGGATAEAERIKSEAEAKEYIFSSAEAGGELNFEWDEAEALPSAEAGHEVNSNIDKAEAETFSPAEAGTKQRPSSRQRPETQILTKLKPILFL
jgi:hypothetical protein